MSTGRARQIHNAATGEDVRFIRTAEETAGELLVIEAHWTRAEHRTPAHVHPAMEERWLVLEGRVGFRIGGEEQVIGPGERAVAPPETLHSNWNAGRGPALMRIELRPAMRWEEFVRQLFALAGEDLEGAVAQRSVDELLGEFAAEIVLPEA